MILRINRVELVDDKYGKHIAIKMITAYDDEDKYLKHVKLTDEIVKIVKETVIMGPFEFEDGLLKDKSYVPVVKPIKNGKGSHE